MQKKNLATLNFLPLSSQGICYIDICLVIASCCPQYNAFEYSQWIMKWVTYYIETAFLNPNNGIIGAENRRTDYGRSKGALCDKSVSIQTEKEGGCVDALPTILMGVN